MTKLARKFSLFLLSAILLFSVTRTFAAPTNKPPEGVSSENWVQYFQYDPPNSNQRKFEFSGTEVIPIPNSGGKALLKNVKVKQFPLGSTKPIMVAETPECIADSRFKELGSAGRLTVHAQDDKFFVEGTGFFLRQNDSRLVLSNDVHSIVQIQASTNSTPAPGTDISSHRAEFQMKTEATNGTAVYLGSVVVKDPRMQMTCELLTAELPDNAGSTNRINRIFAETNVVIDFINEKGEHTHASGQRAVHQYLTLDGATNEILELTGDPRVDLTNDWMTADTFVMNRTTGKLEGKGNFRFHHFSPGKESQPVETLISADQFELLTGTRLAQFWGHVRLSDPRMNVSSETLSTVLPQAKTPNQIDHIIAETGVALDFLDPKSGQKIHATGQKAVYDHDVANQVTNEVLVLTGNPAVETTRPVGFMTADVITLDRAQGKISGVGNQHSVIKRQPSEPAAADTEIFSDEFEFSTDTGLSIYRGQARAFDPELNSISKMLTIKLTKDTHNRTNPVERVDAQGDVSLDFIEKAFAPADITNLTALAVRLKQPDPADAVSRYLASHLSTPTLQLLTNYDGGTNAELRQALTTEFNRFTQSGSLYEPKRFSNVFLSAETSALLEKHPIGVDLVALNRRLLLDAYRHELKNGETGEITHATGDRAIFDTQIIAGKTNQVLELSGSPTLTRPNARITAESTLTYNRTTGSFYADKPHILYTFKNPVKLPGTPKKTAN